MEKTKVSQEFIIGKHGIGYVYSDFIQHVGDVEFELSNTQPKYQKLPKRMDDFQIESELKPGYCTLGDIIAFMGNAPEECKDGWANLFYLPQCVVYVYWRADDRDWSVDAWQRGGIRWIAGYRVFSPATDSGAVSTSTLDTLPLELTINGSIYRRV